MCSFEFDCLDQNSVLQSVSMLNTARVFFRKRKRLGIRCFVKYALFEKKKKKCFSWYKWNLSRYFFIQAKSPFCRTIWLNSFILVMEYLITNQNFCKSKFPVFHKFSFLKKHIYMLIKQHYRYLIFLLNLTIKLDQLHCKLYLILLITQ